MDENKGDLRAELTLEDGLWTWVIWAFNGDGWWWPGVVWPGNSLHDSRRLELPGRPPPPRAGPAGLAGMPRLLGRRPGERRAGRPPVEGDWRGGGPLMLTAQAFIDLILGKEIQITSYGRTVTGIVAALNQNLTTDLELNCDGRRVFVNWRHISILEVDG